MISFKHVEGGMHWRRGAALAVGVMALTACAGVQDDTTNSRLAQAPDAKTRVPIEAGDVVIAGQDFAHAIRDLPEVTNAPKPPLVQFTGVTSLVGPEPVDTDAYTDLLRDRLIVGCGLKLRFIEHQLPPLVVAPKKKIKSHKDLPPPVEVQSDPDYQVIAELRGKSDSDLYRLQIQFIDFHTGAIIYDGLYHIRKEAGDAPVDPNAAPQGGAPPPPQSAETGAGGGIPTQ
jgi:hypothetical protein